MHAYNACMRRDLNGEVASPVHIETLHRNNPQYRLQSDQAWA